MNDTYSLAPNIRGALGKKITFFHFSLLTVVITLFVFKGFDTEELITLISILGPVTGLYGAVAFKSMFNTSKNNAKREFQLNTSSIKQLNFLVTLHFFLIVLIILIKALFNLISFQELALLLGLIETYFGSHMGVIILNLYELK